MFIVAGDLNDAQRGRLTSSLSFQGMNVTDYKLEAVKTVFVDLFCSPKSSMENPSLRVSGHGGSTSRTFIVEDYPEDEYGQWATDEATVEQGWIDDERSCFWTWTTTSMLGSPESFRIAKSKEEKAKEKVKVDPKELVRHTLVKNKPKTLNGGRKKIVLGGPGVKKSRKGSSKGNDGFQKSGFRTNQPEKGTGNE